MRRRLMAWRLGLCVWIVAALVGDLFAASHVAYRKAAKAECGGASEYTGPENQCVAAICPLGAPRRLAEVEFGATRVIAREGYVLEHSRSDKIPLWVCERVTKKQVSGPLRRPKTDPFKPDPDLDKGSRAELRDYKGSGYDRGHQVPSGNQTVDRDLQAQTYYLSNICPQTAQLNQKIWSALEDCVRQWAKKAGPLYVATGPMFYEEAEDNEATADGRVEYATIGDNAVAVPTHFYKIVQWKDAQETWQGVAFVMKNQKTPFSQPYDFDQFIKPIQWVEERTGLDFSPRLTEEDRKRVEHAPGHIWN